MVKIIFLKYFLGIVFSAGVGRTGTYMIIDAMLERVESKKTIDIYSYLTVLRKDRHYMVQTSVRQKHNKGNVRVLLNRPFAHFGIRLNFEDKRCWRTKQ